MRVESLRLRDFRSYSAAEVAIGAGLTVVVGRNGAGKTNLLEALYVGCTGRYCRASGDREAVRFGARAARVEVGVRAQGVAHALAVGIAPGEPKRTSVDGAPVDRLADSPARPLVGVFLPDRLELVKGAPSLRRAHLDGLVAALWPARAATRGAYGRALAQRNALLGRARSGAASPATLATWDAELARHGVALRADRQDALAAVSPLATDIARELGVDGELAVTYRPRSRAETAEALAAELAERRDADLERGFTVHGPHRDDLAMALDGRELRAYGSQGQQRLSLLALLLAEREALAARRDAPPLMLLDDVMSELDAERRARLVSRLRAGGQAIVTATELDHVPGAGDAEVTRVAVAGGGLLEAAHAA